MHDKQAISGISSQIYTVCRFAAASTLTSAPRCRLISSGWTPPPAPSPNRRGGEECSLAPPLRCGEGVGGGVRITTKQRPPCPLARGRAMNRPVLLGIALLLTCFLR